MIRQITFTALALTAWFGTSLLRAETVAYFHTWDDDLSVLRSEAMEPGQRSTAGGAEVEIFKLGEHRVVAAKVGAGDVAAAVIAQGVLTKFPCSRVISVGPVGALEGAAKIGAWFFVERVVAYQRGTEDAGGFLLARAATQTLTVLEAGGGVRKLPRLVVASGEVFSGSNAFRAEVRGRSDADAIDMNLFGLAAAARAHDVPMTALRVISNHAGDGAGVEFGRFSRDYDGEGGRLAVALIRSLSAEDGERVAEGISEIDPSNESSAE